MVVQRVRGREPGSIRAEGLTVIAVSKITRAKLKERAGDMHLSDFLKLVATGEIGPTGGSQVPLPGHERLVSPASLFSLSNGVANLKDTVAILQASIEALTALVTREYRVTRAEVDSVVSKVLESQGMFTDKDREEAV